MAGNYISGKLYISGELYKRGKSLRFLSQNINLQEKEVAALSRNNNSARDDRISFVEKH